MKHIRAILLSAVLTVLFSAVMFGLNVKTAYAYAYTTVYIEVGESYTFTYSCSNPVFDAYSDEDKAVVTASIKTSNKTVTLKGKASGSATLYLNKNGSTANSNRVRTIKVYVYPESTNQTPNIKNSISHSATDSSNYTNQAIYAYAGNSFTCTLSCSNVPGSVSSDTTGKAKAFSASGIYECADSSGTVISNNVYNLSAGSLSGNSRTFTVKSTLSNYKLTYVKALGSWTSSNGTVHGTKARVSNVNCYLKPAIYIFNNAGASISSLTLSMGNPQSVTTSVKNLINTDTVDMSVTSQDQTKVTVSENSGGYSIIPVGVTNGITTKVAFTVSLDNRLTERNGSSYTTFTKYLTVSIGQLNPVTITKATVNKSSIKVEWGGNENASSYAVYRAESEKGNYEEVGTTGECYYLDDDEDLVYGKTYYYKVKAVGSDESTTSDFSEAYGITYALKTPKILSAVRVDGKYKIQISGTKYTGYEISQGASHKVLGTTTSSYLLTSLSVGTHDLYVRAYYTDDDGKIYGSYSDVYTLEVKKTTTSSTTSSSKSSKVSKKIKRPDFKVVRKNGKLSITIRKKASKYNAKGFIVKVKRSGKTVIKSQKWYRQKLKITNIKKGVTYKIYIRSFKGKKKSKWRIKSVRT